MLMYIAILVEYSENEPKNQHVSNHIEKRPGKEENRINIKSLHKI